MQLFLLEKEMPGKGRKVVLLYFYFFPHRYQSHSPDLLFFGARLNQIRLLHYSKAEKRREIALS